MSYLICLILAQLKSKALQMMLALLPLVSIHLFCGIYWRKAIKTATDWGKKVQLTFGAEKTVIVLYTKRKKIPKIPKIKVMNVEVPYQDHAKYLGVILDGGLTFNEHIKQQIKKAKNALNRITGSIGKLWGPVPKLMKWVYTGIIRPILTLWVPDMGIQTYG